jgi:glutamate:GABA antiporter
MTEADMADIAKQKQTRVLGVFSLAMITVAAIISLRNLPLSAEFGLSSVFYFVVAALVFFIPIALVTAELATAWPRPGGNYVWVGEAFGKATGFFALWMAWMESIAWFPAILAFTAAMLAHFLAPIFPGLEHNKYFYFAVMLIVFWGATFINFLGMETSSWISTLGVLAGTVIPGFLIIALGVYWIIMGHPTHIDFSFAALIPEFRFDTMVFFSGILLGLAGIEVAVFHIREAKNPQKDYPKALIMASVMILILSILGTLSIAIVVPGNDISLLSGLIQAFTVFFSAFNMLWAVPLIAFLALIGSLAGINTWTVGPAKGLLVTVEDGFLPRALHRINKKGVPVGMLIFQAIVGSLLSLVFLWMDSHSAAYWVLTALAAQFTVVQYGLVFIAALWLRYKSPNTTRPFKVPGGKFGIWVITIIGVLACLFGFAIVFVPPSQINTGDRFEYQTMLLISFSVLALLPLIMAWCRSSSSRA